MNQNKPFDAPKAAHQTRMQLSGIACERELNHEEKILHTSVTRYLNRLFMLCEANLESQQNQEPQSENPPRISDSRPKEVPPGEEPGLLPSN